MKQLTLWDSAESKKSAEPKQKKTQSKPSWHLYVDGAARNNPGPAGAGFCLFNNGKPVLKKGFFLGTKTNNQAEYLALLLGLFFTLKKINLDEPLAIFADSQLLVRQIDGTYKIKNNDLKLLRNLAFKMLMPCNYSISHVMRENNQHADEMANEGIDKKIKPPQEFITVLRDHEIPY